ncbi:hypothetical protein PL372_11135 [Tenacibaculum dicentrarchi]|nr:hypothetical protein [Tenacibaculum dicentrarchi]
MKTKTQKLFNSANENYKSIKELSESKVVEWVWLKNFYYSLDPYYNEELNFPKTRKVVKLEPTDKNYHSYCGIDDKGNIVVKRTFDNIGYYDNFYQYDIDEIIYYRFNIWKTNTTFKNCRIYKHDNGRIKEIYFCGEEKTSYTNYVYKGEVLISKEEEHYDKDSKKTEKYTTIYEYDDKNILDGIRTKSGYYRYKRKTGLSFTKLKIEVEKRLLKLIKNHIQNNKPQKEIFTLFLAYTSQNFFPPIIAFGLDEERKEFIAKYDYQYIWEYQEYEYFEDFIEMSDEDENLLDEFNQQIQMKNKYNIAKKMIIDIAVD